MIRVHGIDFSGARDAGRHVFVASGRASRGGVLIDSSRRGDTLIASGVDRDTALAALREFIAGAGPCVVGCDFPFGLPRALQGRGSWRSFALALGARHADADAFRAACRERTRGREWRRVADDEARAPFAPMNLRVYRQAFHGIRDVLAPLVRDGRARVAPMQAPRGGLPVLVEACPASTLRAAGLYRPYKGPSEEHRAARAAIVRTLERRGALAFGDPAIPRALVADACGDALDSVLAALAAARAEDDLRSLRPEHRVEGRIYY